MDEDSKNTEPGSGQQTSPVDFSGLILGFSSASLYYLGEATIQGKENQESNLPLAKQNIDILELLQNKTQGNLSDEESRLLSQVLSDLRMKFIAVMKN